MVAMGEPDPCGEPHPGKLRYILFLEVSKVSWNEQSWSPSYMRSFNPRRALRPIKALKTSTTGSLGWLGQPGLSFVGLGRVGLNIRWAWAGSGRAFLSPG